MAVRDWQSLRGSWFPLAAQGEGTGARQPILGAALPMEGRLVPPCPASRRTPHGCLCRLLLSSEHRQPPALTPLRSDRTARAGTKEARHARGDECLLAPTLQPAQPLQRPCLCPCPSPCPAPGFQSAEQGRGKAERCLGRRGLPGLRVCARGPKQRGVALHGWRRGTWCWAGPCWPYGAVSIPPGHRSVTVWGRMGGERAVPVFLERQARP